MTNTTNSQDLCKRIEDLVEEYISATRVAAQAALDRAFAPAPCTRPSRPRTPVAATARRATDALEVLSERLYEAVSQSPGETMAVIASVVGATARELNRPMHRLKEAGRIRSVGRRQATRYFPMAREEQRAST